MVLSAALQEGFVFLSLVGVITSVISAVYYLNIVKLLFFSNHSYKKVINLIPVKNKNIDLNPYNISSINQMSLSNAFSIIISILTLFILLFIFVPDPLLHLSNILSIFLFNSSSNITLL